jgi:hypothetical protein
VLLISSAGRMKGRRRHKRAEKERGDLSLEAAALHSACRPRVPSPVPFPPSFRALNKPNVLPDYRASTAPLSSTGSGRGPGRTPHRWREARTTLCAAIPPLPQCRRPPYPLIKLLPIIHVPISVLLGPVRSHGPPPTHTPARPRHHGRPQAPPRRQRPRRLQPRRVKPLEFNLADLQGDRGVALLLLYAYMCCFVFIKRSIMRRK